jgi:hypothetical protein
MSCETGVPMRDREARGGSHGGAGQIRPVFWSRTEHQIAPFGGFKPEEVTPRSPMNPSSADGYTLRLAEPPKWTHRDDLPCTQLVPKGNARDPFDTNNSAKAKALCAGCPVLEACLEDALVQEGDLVGRSRWLVRGGLTPKERAVRSARMARSGQVE